MHIHFSDRSQNCGRIFLPSQCRARKLLDNGFGKHLSILIVAAQLRNSRLEFLTFVLLGALLVSTALRRSHSRTQVFFLPISLGDVSRTKSAVAV